MDEYPAILRNTFRLDLERMKRVDGRNQEGRWGMEMTDRDMCSCEEQIGDVFTCLRVAIPMLVAGAGHAADKGATVGDFPLVP